MISNVKINNLGYAQKQRLLYIESIAYWEGGVGRSRIANVFGISENHITRDFTLYRKAYPKNLDYDVSSRTYRPGDKFKTKLSNGEPEEYLSLLRTYVETKNSTIMPTISETVNAAGIPVINYSLHPNILKELTRAICSKQSLMVQYQSMKESDPYVRNIWPHTLIFSGYRWHVRVFDEDKSIYTDLVLHRIILTTPNYLETRELPIDKEFECIKKINICPNEKLSTSQKIAIAQEYGMIQVDKNWVWKVKIRECLIPYFLYWLRLDTVNGNMYISLSDKSIRENYSFSNK